MTNSLSEPTGTAYLASPPDRVLSSFLNVSNPTFSNDQTGQDIKTQARVQPDFVEYLPIENLLRNTTGSELPVSNISFAFFKIVADKFVTGYRVTFSFKGSFPETFHQVSSQEFPGYNRKSSTRNPAARLREISGLDVGRLAYIFQVSRPAYHRWLVSSIPRIIHREHLLEVLSLVEEALQRLGNPKDVADWLLTPITATGTKPIDYLRNQKYLTFRGFLLSIRTGNEVTRPLNTPTLVRNELPREEMGEEIENLSPRTLLSDEINPTDIEL